MKAKGKSIYKTKDKVKITVGMTVFYIPNGGLHDDITRKRFNHIEVKHSKVRKLNVFNVIVVGKNTEIDVEREPVFVSEEKAKQYLIELLKQDIEDLQNKVQFYEEVVDGKRKQLNKLQKKKVG